MSKREFEHDCDRPVKVIADVEGLFAELLKAMQTAEVTYKNDQCDVQHPTMLMGDIFPCKPQDSSNGQTLSDCAETLNVYFAILKAFLANDKIEGLLGNRELNLWRLFIEWESLTNDPSQPLSSFPSTLGLSAIHGDNPKFRTVQEWLNVRKLPCNAMNILEFMLSQTMGCGEGAAEVHFEAARLRSTTFADKPLSDFRPADYNVLAAEIRTYLFAKDTGIVYRMHQKWKLAHLRHTQEGSQLFVHGMGANLKWQVCCKDGKRDVRELNGDIHNWVVIHNKALTTALSSIYSTNSVTSLDAICTMAYLACDGNDGTQHHTPHRSVAYGSILPNGKFDKITYDANTDFAKLCYEQGVLMVIAAHQPCGDIECVFKQEGVIFVHTDIRIRSVTRCDTQLSIFDARVIISSDNFLNQGIQLTNEVSQDSDDTLFINGDEPMGNAKTPDGDIGLVYKRPGKGLYDIVYVFKTASDCVELPKAPKSV